MLSLQGWRAGASRRDGFRDAVVIYAKAKVSQAWLVNPDQRLPEVLRLGSEGWVRVAAHRDDERIRAEPFDAIELELGLLWSDAEQ